MSRKTRELCAEDGFVKEEVEAILNRLRRQPTEAEIDEAIRVHEAIETEMRRAGLQHAELLRRFRR